MLRRLLAIALASTALACTACGGGPRSTVADLAAIQQPTPDPTLDAVVRDLPRALAGVAPSTATPAPRAVVVAKPVPATPAPTARSLQRPPTATPTRTRR
jgi:hypothetical protein